MSGSAGTRIRSSTHGSCRRFTKLMEKPDDSALNIVGDTVTAPIHPFEFEILTMRVDYAANQKCGRGIGTALCTIENGARTFSCRHTFSGFS